MLASACMCLFVCRKLNTMASTIAWSLVCQFGSLHASLWMSRLCIWLVSLSLSLAHEGKPCKDGSHGKVNPCTHPWIYVHACMCASIHCCHYFRTSMQIKLTYLLNGQSFNNFLYIPLPRNTCKTGLYICDMQWMVASHHYFCIYCWHCFLWSDYSFPMPAPKRRCTYMGSVSWHSSSAEKHVVWEHAYASARQIL